MTTLVTKGTKELMSEHADALREYAIRVFQQGETLTPAEDEDRASRVKELLAFATVFNVTETEMVSLLYKDLFVAKKGCDCPDCRLRKGLVQ